MSSPPYGSNPYAVTPYGGGVSPDLTPVPTTTSGTTSFNLDIGEIISEAFERCGILNVSGRDFRTARRSIDLMMQEWANRGLNLWTVEEDSETLIQGTQTYDLAVDTIDLIETELRTNVGTINQQDYTLNRISVSTWATIPNKLIEGRPVQIYVNRQITPQFTVWPVPDGAATYTLAYWRLRRIQDTGTPASNIMDLPFRFMPALCAGLAYHVSTKKPEAYARMPDLKMAYEEQFKLAADEDRTRASVRFVPYIPYIGSG